MVCLRNISVDTLHKGDTEDDDYDDDDDDNNNNDNNNNNNNNNFLYVISIFCVFLFIYLCICMFLCCLSNWVYGHWVNILVIKNLLQSLLILSLEAPNHKTECPALMLHFLDFQFSNSGAETGGHVFGFHCLLTL